MGQSVLKQKEKVLIVDDAKFSVRVLGFDLEQAGYDYIVAYDGPEALEALKENQVDMILLDVYMPTMSGLEVLAEIKKNPETSSIPVIMLSASESENEIVSALDLGADDYVTKPYISRVLLARLRTSLRLKEKTAELERLATTDFLTGLTNRRLFKQQTCAQIDKNKRDGEMLSVAMIDVDHFKRVNDQYGHDVGDLVLVKLAEVLKKHFRSYDVVARLGGEEFAILMPDTSFKKAYTALERLRRKIEKIEIETSKSKQTFNITVSIGLTHTHSGNKSYDELLKVADQCLYQAKNNGRNQTVSSELPES